MASNDESSNTCVEKDEPMCESEMDNSNAFAETVHEEMDTKVDESNKSSTELEIEILQHELETLDASLHPKARELLKKEIKILTEGNNLIELHNDKQSNHSVSVIVPIKDNPEFPYVGNLLGKRGATLQEIQRQTGTKLTILGEGSIKDKNKEEMFRKQGNGMKLLGPLHLEIRCQNHAEEAYKRIAMTLGILKIFLHPTTCKQTQSNLASRRDFLQPPPPPHYQQTNNYSYMSQRGAPRGSNIYGPRPRQSMPPPQISSHERGSSNRGGRNSNQSSNNNTMAVVSAVLQAASNMNNSSNFGQNGDFVQNDNASGRGRLHPYTRGRGFPSGRGCSSSNKPS